MAREDGAPENGAAVYDGLVLVGEFLGVQEARTYTRKDGKPGTEYAKIGLKTRGGVYEVAIGSDDIRSTSRSRQRHRQILVLTSRINPGMVRRECLSPPMRSTAMRAPTLTTRHQQPPCLIHLIDAHLIGTRTLLTAHALRQWCNRTRSALTRLPNRVRCSSAKETK